MIRRFQLAGQRAWLRMEGALNAVFGPALNPFYFLGGIAYFLLWVLVASGFYVYFFFDTGVVLGYQSLEDLTRKQPYLGGVLRSLHHYAADGMVLAMTLHLLREFFMDRYRNFRWFSWVTGVPLLWLVYASGIGGYWQVWDRLAQFIAIGTAEWFDYFPIFGEPLVRNFLEDGGVSDRFFSLLAFAHIGIPLLLMVFLWVHTQRITRAVAAPPAPVALGILLALAALSLIKPILSHAAADLGAVPNNLKFDWFYLAVYPLLYIWSPGAVWALTGGFTLLLFLLPWLPPRMHQEPIVEVHLDNCNGCGNCVADCPYAALSLEPRTDGRRFVHEAVLRPDLCASCGVCVGSCPYAMPFRSVGELVSGVDLPDVPVRALRATTDKAVAALAGEARVMVFGCDHAPKIVKAPGVAYVGLRCIGMLPPSFIDYALRGSAVDGVFIIGCADCRYRRGDQWLKQRLAGERDPRLRGRVSRERVHHCSVTDIPGGRVTAHREFAEFREHLRRLPRRRVGSETGSATPRG